MLENFLASFSIENREEKIKQFSLFREYLLEQNKLFNLTAVTDEKEIERRHFLDSLAAIPFIKGDVLDIGSGAGFPSVPLKIVYPQNHFTLVDSLLKRVVFLKRVFSLLSLNDCTAIHTRIEDFEKKGAFDTVLSRAVARMNTLCEYALPFVKIGGTFIAYKTQGKELEEELKEAKKAIAVLGGEVERVVNVAYKEINDLHHALVLIKKTKETPVRYPRGKNKPKTQPIV